MKLSWYSVSVIRIFTIKKYLHSIAVDMHIIAIFFTFTEMCFLVWVFIELRCWAVASGKGFNVFTENLMWNQQKKIQTGKLQSFVVFEIFLKIDHCKIYDFIA